MFDSIWSTISGWLGDTLSSILESVLYATIFKLCYFVEATLCRIIAILSELFDVFAGVDRVTYNGESNFLMNIFFNNKAISNIYWAMALIGIALTFVFTIWSVIKKMFDASGKVQQSHGQILTAGVRSIIMIVGLTFIMNVVITATNVLMQQIAFIFNDPYHLDQPVNRKFTEEEYAAMCRVLATVGNYSMVPSNNNRYNLNLCYNDIRPDLYYLERQGVFDYSYYDTDKNGNVIVSWQSLLANIAKSGNLDQDVPVDVYNAGIANSIMEAMRYLKNNESIRPLDHINRNYVADNDMHLDRVVFLMGTLRAANNDTFNKKPSMDDALRGPYYYNQGGNIYDFDQVSDDFDIGFKTDYILVWIACCAAIVDLVVILLNCVARLFNMMFLYIIAPPIFAAMPLDNGGKFKQWTTAFLVQSLSVFGTVIAMRLLLIYLPMVMDPRFVLFPKSANLDMFARFVLVFGGFEAAKKSTALLTGILADSAGWQAIQAGDMSTSASAAIGAVVGAGAAVGGKALSAGGSVASFAAKPATNLAKRPFKAAGEWWTKLGTGGRQNREEDSIKNRVSQGKADEAYLKNHPDDAKYLQPGAQRQGQPGPQPGPQPNNPNDPNNPNQPPNQQANQNGPRPAGGPQNPPPLPGRYREAPDDAPANAYRNAHGPGQLGPDDPQPQMPQREMPLPSRNRPSLD